MFRSEKQTVITNSASCTRYPVNSALKDVSWCYRQTETEA